LTDQKNFCCDPLLPSSKTCTVQTAFVKTSISVPPDMMAWIKARSVEEGNMPVSRIIAAAVREKIARETKTKGVKNANR